MKNNPIQNVLNRLRDDREWRRARESEQDEKSAPKTYDSKIDWHSIGENIVQWILKSTSSKAYYGFCGTLVAIGAGLVTPSIYEAILASVLVEFDPESQSKLDFWLPKFIGISLIITGVILAVRHNKNN